MTLNDFETQLREQTRALLLNNALSGDAPTRRTAVQVIRSGLGSLSWPERFLYLGRVAPLLREAPVLMAAGTASTTAEAPTQALEELAVELLARGLSVRVTCH